MHDSLHDHAAMTAPGRPPRILRGVHDLLERDYARLRPIVARIVGARLQTAIGWVDEGVVDAAYNQAWHAVYVKLTGGEEIDDLPALLVMITHRRAIDDLRTQHWDRRTSERSEHRGSFEPDLAAGLDDQIQLQHAFEAMREKLDPRERHAAVLCYLLGHSRAQAAVRIGVSRKRMEKVMDGVSRKLAQIAPGLDGQQWCRERSGLIRSYALGLLAPESERYAQAAQHLAGCSGCRRQVLVIRGLGAVVPPAPMLAMFVRSPATPAGPAAAIETPLASPGGWSWTAARGTRSWTLAGGPAKIAAITGASLVAAVAVVGLAEALEDHDRPVDFAPAPAARTISGPGQTRWSDAAAPRPQWAGADGLQRIVGALVDPSASPFPGASPASLACVFGSGAGCVRPHR